jgi:2-polyprenyl-3-methyl-5-hydroxy-6-metoxy-1,4-benzoquinol methylase
MDTTKKHWDSVYESKPAEAVSWYAPHLRESLRYISQAATSKEVAIIDVGGGESTLVDDLVNDGYSNISILDISATALEVTKRRLGATGAHVTWIAADILEVELPVGAYDIWHDRAVFHFLINDDQRRRYVAQVLKALKPGGFAIVGTFGPEGPEKCSGLQVSRYAPSELHGTFGAPFELLDSSVEQHTTPWGSPQQFVYCYCRRANS